METLPNEPVEDDEPLIFVGVISRTVAADVPPALVAVLNLTDDSWSKKNLKLSSPSYY